MVRQVSPGTVPEITAKEYKVNNPDFSAMYKLGDKLVDAANNNFLLYASNIASTESQKLYEQYKTDPIKLADSLRKIPDMFGDLPPEVQDKLKSKLLQSNITLVQKAQNNYLVEQDQNTRTLADANINDVRVAIQEVYASVLQNETLPKEEKDLTADARLAQYVVDLRTLGELKDHNGKYIYSDKQRNTINDISNMQTEAFKQFIDAKILNDDKNLTESKDYYTKFILAPERFMKNNFMNRETYDKVRSYAEKQLKQAGAEIEKARFNQSAMEATALQVENLPGTLDFLKEEGVIDKKIINQIEKTNVKFDELDPSKDYNPADMINALDIIATHKSDLFAPETLGDQQKILEQGTVALDAVAEYAQAYGMSPKNVRTIREAVANIETNAAFRPVLESFSDVITNFNDKLGTVRGRIKNTTGKAKLQNITSIDGLTAKESEKIINLNRLLAISTDMANQYARAGNFDAVRQVQKDVQKGAAQILYSDWVDWDKYNENPDTIFPTKDGRKVKVVDFTLDGDVIFDVLNEK